MSPEKLVYICTARNQSYQALDDGRRKMLPCDHRAVDFLVVTKIVKNCRQILFLNHLLLVAEPGQDGVPP